MPNTLSDKDWNIILGRIKDGTCTPFLGAGACYGSLPLGGEIAKAWAGEFHYPLQDISDLARVSQYVAIETEKPQFPKLRLKQQFDTVTPPTFMEPDEPHGVLAD